MKTTHYYFLRHGEVADKTILAGHTDLSLGEQGMQQMRSSTYGLDIHRCMSSPLKRCLQFAKEFSFNQSLDLEVNDSIKEMNFGDWDGQPYQALWQMPSPNVGDFWQSPIDVTPPNGESYADFSQRISLWWQAQLDVHHPLTDHVDQNHESEQNVLVVTHAGVIKQILGLVTQLQPLSQIHSRVSVGYGSVVCIKVYADANHPPWATLVL